MSLSQQFLDASSGARTGAALDELTRQLWRAHAEGLIADVDAEAASAAVQARRAVLEGVGGPNPPKAVLGLPRGAGAGRRREKVFGLGRPRALDRNAKVRIMHWARCLSRRTEKGRAYGQLTAKAVAVLEALLWAFHNAKSGLCFPGYETIARAAHCARSTVAEAIKTLEEAGVLTWVHRIKRVREAAPDLFGNQGWKWRVERTSNAYNFQDPSPAADRPAPRRPTESEKATGTPTQGLSSSFVAAFGGKRTGRSGRKEALRRKGWDVSALQGDRPSP